MLFVGYQAEGTLGRRLYDGEKHVKLFGEDIEVNCEIGFLPGKSGHADRDGLTAWLAGFEKKPKLVFVNHGEDAGRRTHLPAIWRPSTAIRRSRLTAARCSISPRGNSSSVRRACRSKRRRPLRTPRRAGFIKSSSPPENRSFLIRASRGKPNKTLKHFLSDVEELLKKYR